jgi:hypothetical protein
MGRPETREAGEKLARHAASTIAGTTVGPTPGADSHAHSLRCPSITASSHSPARFDRLSREGARKPAMREVKPLRSDKRRDDRKARRREGAAEDQMQSARRVRRVEDQNKG